MPPRKPSEKHAGPFDDLDGLTKIAVLLLALDEDAATALMRRLPPDVVEEVSRLIATIGDVPDRVTERVVDEFYQSRMSTQYGREGGLPYAETLVRSALEPDDAERVIRQVSTHVQKSPFSFLQKAESENLLTFIQDEHPQTIALVLSHLPHAKAAEILIGLPQGKQIEVVRRIANMEQTNPEVIREVELGLESRLSSMLVSRTERVGGVSTVAEILNLCDRGTEKTILEGIEVEQAELVEDIRRLMFVFEDILLVNDKGIQAVLKEVDNDELCLALKTASEELRDKILSNMSTRAAALIREDMEYMGPVRLSDVESSQQRIVDIVRRFEDSGEIIIAGRGAEKDIIV